MSYQGRASNYRHRFDVTLDNDMYKSKTFGVCGNWNDKQDDLRPKDERRSASKDETITIFNSYQIAGDCYFCKLTIRLID